MIMVFVDVCCARIIGVSCLLPFFGVLIFGRMLARCVCVDSWRCVVGESSGVGVLFCCVVVCVVSSVFCVELVM